MHAIELDPHHERYDRIRASTWVDSLIQPWICRHYTLTRLVARQVQPRRSKLMDILSAISLALVVHDNALRACRHSKLYSRN